MILTKAELLASLQKEVRILLHLAGKIDRGQLDYRPTPKQRSTIELLRYLSTMGPMLMDYAKGASANREKWMADTKALAEVANARNFDETLAAIAAHADEYKRLLQTMSDADFRTEVIGFDGRPMTAGSFIVNHVLGQCAAYRTQLFLYLKACGREELNTMNLWVGADPSAPAPAA
jgi:hypothetical protein